MTGDGPNRVTSGSPAGGQFSAAQRAEADIELPGETRVDRLSPSWTAEENEAMDVIDNAHWQWVDARHDAADADAEEWLRGISADRAADIHGDLVAFMDKLRRLSPDAADEALKRIEAMEDYMNTNGIGASTADLERLRGGGLQVVRDDTSGTYHPE